MVTHSLTTRDRVIAVVTKQEGPCTVLGVETNEDGRALEHSVDLDESLVVGTLLHANMVPSDVANLEGSRPAEEASQRSEPRRETARRLTRRWDFRGMRARAEALVQRG